MAARPGAMPRGRDLYRRAGGIWLAAGLLWFALEGFCAAAYPGYRYARNYISDLGVPGGSPRHLLMNATFVAHGLLFLLGALLLARASGAAGPARRIFLGLATIYASGSVLVGAFHSAAAGAADGAARLHLLGAAMAILGGNAAIIACGLRAGRFGRARRFGGASVATGALGLACVLALQLGPPFGLPGAWERGAVYTITLWEIAGGLVLLAAARHRRAGADARAHQGAR